MENTQQTKLAAIVFTDIVGYTQKMDSDEMLTMTYLDRQREIVYPIVKDFGGKILKEIGDGLLIMFDSAAQAVRATIEIQSQLKDEAFKIRAGVHVGDVIMKDGDVFGAAVNIAARIEPQAEPGGICVSEVVRNQIQNKIDIQTVSIGIRDLKGVKQPIEIYEVLFGDAKEKKVELTSFLKHMWMRRVPHISGIYGLLILFIYFVLEYVASRYALSPHLVQFGTVLLLSLFPSVIIISYFHGRAASGEWKKIERFGLPINLVVSAVFLFSIFNGKDLGATVKAVNVMDENGNVIEREITKSEFRKSMAIFFFENKTADTSLNWIQYAMPFLISYDLLQDIFIRTENEMNFYQKIKDEGYSFDEVLPLAIKNKIATNRYLNYIVTGSFTKDLENQFILKVEVRQTKTSKLIASYERKGMDVFELADIISLQLKSDIELPAVHIENAKDLPISEMLTKSETALKFYILAVNQRFINNDYQKAKYYSEKAVAEDPLFIMAHAQLVDIYISTNKKELADQSFETVMKNMDRLPEQIRFRMKYSYYLLVRQQPDKAFAIVKMWKELYPYDTEAYLMLATLYQLQNEPQKTIEEYEAVMALDPDRYDLILEIARLYESQAKYDKALAFYKKYAALFPESSTPYVSIGNLNLMLREYDKSKANFERALLIEHDNIDALIGLADVDFLMGKLDQLEKQYYDILKLCKTPQESYNIYESIIEFYEYKGQMKKALAAMDEQFIEYAKYTEPINVIISKVMKLDQYVKAGQSDRAFQIIKGFEKELSDPINKFISLGYLSIYQQTKDADNLKIALTGVKDVIATFKYEVLNPLVTKGEAKVFEFNGEYKEAIKIYEKLLKDNPRAISMNYSIGHCYRMLEKYDKAESFIQIVLDRTPNDPEYNLEMAMIYAKQDKIDNALSHLKTAIKVWEDADYEYEPARLAQEKYLELTQ